MPYDSFFPELEAVIPSLEGLALLWALVVDELEWTSAVYSVMHTSHRWSE
jgi:hypothetical protein